MERVAQYYVGENQKDFSDFNLYQIFEGCAYGLPIVLDDTIESMNAYCKKGEKISFRTLNERISLHILKVVN